MKKAILLKVGVDGEHELSQVNFGTEHTLEDYYRLVDCSTIDVVSCYGISGINADMIVDDEGLLNDKPVNYLASVAYGYKQHGQPIVGNTLIVKPVETPDGVIEDGFTAESVEVALSEEASYLTVYKADVEGESIPVGISGIASGNNGKVQKVLRDGKIVIVKGDKEFNVNGAAIK